MSLSDQLRTCCSRSQARWCSFSKSSSAQTAVTSRIESASSAWFDILLRAIPDLYENQKCGILNSSLFERVGLT